MRWPGEYEPAVHLEPLVDLIPTLAKEDCTVLTILNLPEPASTRDYIHAGSCSGCLLLPTAITLSCRHSFCELCVRDIMGPYRPLYLLPTICCLFCPRQQTFSPRFLPDSAGYRILAFDDGGMRAASFIKILQSLERERFGIPVRFLFDFFIGVGAGALVAVAVASTQPRFTKPPYKVRWEHPPLPQIL
jgi:hypothetical protein